jgi:hypothetical protein
VLLPVRATPKPATSAPDDCGDEADTCLSSDEVDEPYISGLGDVGVR